MIRIRTSLIPWHKGVITNLVAWWCRIECGPAGLGEVIGFGSFFMSASHMVLRLLGYPSPMQLSQAISGTPSCINNLDSEGQVLGCCQVLGCISNSFKSKIREIFTILWAIFVRRILPRDKSSGVPKATGKTQNHWWSLSPRHLNIKHGVPVQELQRDTIMEIQKVL